MASGAWNEYATGDGASHGLFAASSTSEEEDDDGAPQGLFAPSSSEERGVANASSNKKSSFKRSEPSCWADEGQATAVKDLFHKPCLVSASAWARAVGPDRRWLADLSFVGASQALLKGRSPLVTLYSKVCRKEFFLGACFAS